MPLTKYIPDVFLQVLQRLGITLILLSVTRIIFFAINYIRFPNFLWYDFISGVWFDAITIGMWFSPFFLLSLIPNPWRWTTFYRVLLKVIFHFTNATMLIFNLIDFEYFKFTSKRSTADLFTIMTAGNDFAQQIGAFIKDFWWILLLFLLLLFISEKLYQLTSRSKKSTETYNLKIFAKQMLTFVFGSAILLIIGRGGFGLKPADMLTAAQFTKAENTALVLNTPLTIIKTFGKESLKEVDFLPEEEIYNPIKKIHKNRQVGNQPNVVIIILESFGNEWLGKKQGSPFTPFLDSLLDESLYFTNAYANGKKSIEAMPAIFASIPTLLDNPYISSHYGTNTIEGLPDQLKKLGYQSAFFHGATNGSMKFDEFAQLAGFDHYFGRVEYGNEAHCDDTWGVLDEYFNPWTAKMISKKLSPPFLAGLFTLSSHHPYFIPEKHRDQLPKGPAPIASSIAYGDLSLRLFFEQAKKEDWYENTIFVIVADHTPAGTSEFYTNPSGRYQIPIAFFTPNKSISPKEENKLFSQIDIYPTILDLVGFKEDYYAFGNSYFSKEKKWVANYIGGTYHFIQDDYLLNFINGKSNSFYNYELDPLLRSDSLSLLIDRKEELEFQLKRIIQRYNRDLIFNKMTAP